MGQDLARRRLPHHFVSRKPAGGPANKLGRDLRFYHHSARVFGRVKTPAMDPKNTPSCPTKKYLSIHGRAGAQGQNIGRGASRHLP